MITCVYLLVAEFSAPKIYNYWAVLSLDIFLLIFWLCSFAYLASQVAIIFGYTTGSYYSYYSNTYYYYYYSRSEVLVWASCLAAAAGLGALEL